jgi:hypothetical protein
MVSFSTSTKTQNLHALRAERSLACVQVCVHSLAECIEDVREATGANGCHEGACETQWEAEKLNRVYEHS